MTRLGPLSGPLLAPATATADRRTAPAAEYAERADPTEEVTEARDHIRPVLPMKDQASKRVRG